MLLGLLMCGQVAPAAQGPGGNYPELFASFFAEHDVTLVRVDLDQGELPGDLDVVDGWITTGSATNCWPSHWGAPWSGPPSVGGWASRRTG